jgi:hypothetical protein
LYLAIGNLILLFVWFIPLALVLGLLGLSPVGMILIGLIVILGLFSLNIWGEITREPASRELEILFQEMAEQQGEQEQTEEDPDVEQNQQDEKESQKPALFKHWLDILLLTFVLPWLRLNETLGQYLGAEQKTQKPWLASNVLVIPLIAVEDLDLKNSIDRIDQMTSDHLFRFQPGWVKVDLVARTAQWIIGFFGLLIGSSVALLITDPLEEDPWLRILGLGIGLIIFWLFITLGNIISAYSRSCYHTALYQWVRNVEEARQLDDPGRAVPPDILRRALGKFAISKEER